jgi:hypothetical protein
MSQHHRVKVFPSLLPITCASVHSLYETQRFPGLIAATSASPFTLIGPKLLRQSDVTLNSPSNALQSCLNSTSLVGLQLEQIESEPVDAANRILNLLHLK